MDYSTIANTLLAQMTNQNNAAPSKRAVVTVAGLSDARSFNLQPGESVVLIDSNDDYFYIKECDDIGKSTTRCFKYEEVEVEEVSTNGVSKKEFDKLSGDVKELKNMMKEFTNGKHNPKQDAQ